MVWNYKGLEFPEQGTGHCGPGEWTTVVFLLAAWLVMQGARLMSNMQT